MLEKIDLNKPVCLDIETTGLHRFTDDITSLQLGYTNVITGKYERKFFDWAKTGMKSLLKLLTFLKKAKLVTHNGKFDLLFIYVKTGIELNLWVDTLVLAHVCGEVDLGLKPLVKKYFNVDYDIATEAKKGKITDAFISYGLDDVLYPVKLMKIFKKKLNMYDLVKVYKHEMRAYRAYYEVEKNGVPISPRRGEIAKKLIEEYMPIYERLITIADINWNSTAQVSSILFGKKNKPIYKEKGEKLPNTYEVIEYLFTGEQIVRGEFDTRKEATQFKEEYLAENNYLYGIDVKLKHNFKPVIIGYGVGLKVIEKTAKGVPSVSSDVLMNYVGNPVVDDLLEYRRLTKLETFIKSWDKIQVNDKIYPSFNITARTGRTTCSNPNLQQIPQDKNVRNLIEARPGWKIIEQDFSQIELRVASMFSGDANMQHAYQSGSDLHSKTTELLFGDTSEMSPQEKKRKRTQAKSCFSGDTEILTEDGFVEFKMYDGITPVAQYNIETQEISYVDPLDFRMIPNQKVCVFENENTSLKLTPNHECIIQVQNSRKYMKKVPFEELAGHGQSKYAWVNAGYYKYEKCWFIKDDMTRLVACFVADGSYSESKTQIRFGFTKKRKIERFRNMVDRLGVDYDEKVQGKLKVTYFTISDFDYVCNMKRYCTADKTLLKPAMTELNPLVYLEEASHWDGHVNHTNLITVSSTNRSTLDSMQIMAVQSGVRARLYKVKDERDNVSDTWTLSYNLNKKPLSRFESKDIDLRTHHNTNHNVYCVTVPEHNIVIRHNGKVSIQGNCNFGFLYGMSAKTFVDYAKGYGLNITEEQSEGLRNNFFEAYPRLLPWHEECKQYARKNGHTWSPIGRKRFLPDINSSNWSDRGSAERQSINSGVQGFASDMCISALSDIVFSDIIDHERCKVLGSVHDAILFEVKDDYVDKVVPMIKEMMEHPSIIEGIDIPIPIIADVEVAQAWGG